MDTLFSSVEQYPYIQKRKEKIQVPIKYHNRKKQWLSKFYPLEYKALFQQWQHKRSIYFIHLSLWFIYVLLFFFQREAESQPEELRKQIVKNARLLIEYCGTIQNKGTEQINSSNNVISLWWTTNHGVPRGGNGFKLLWTAFRNRDKGFQSTHCFFAAEFIVVLSTLIQLSIYHLFFVL